MTETAILLDHISKKFVLHPERARSFLDRFLHTSHRVLGRGASGTRREFWAMQDVSFEVPRGQMLTFLGANGSGKSTTLKLIAGILRPTRGSITVNGRVAAMLELGTGFHPDLTGRENVYLSGAILGLTTAQMHAVIDEIIEFAGIGDFIDVPVRNYSSGMYVRLGFAVATHVRADILLIDEVLAVGDQGFQQKCLEKVHTLKRGGVTIVFVTHHLEQARNISDRVIWFRDGAIGADDRPDIVVPQYLAYLRARATVAGAAEGEGCREPPGSDAYLECVHVLDAAGQPCHAFRTGEPLTIRLTYRTRRRVESPVFGLAIFRDDGLRVNGPNTGLAELSIDAIEGRGCIDYAIVDLPLLSGRYYVTAGLFDKTGAVTFDYGDQMATFEVRPTPGTDLHGIVQLNARWQHRTAEPR